MRNRSQTWVLITICYVVGVICFSTFPGDNVAADDNLVPDNIADLAPPTQPISFSHELHAGELDLDCTFCHSSPAPGKKMTFPAESTCMSCHAVMEAESAEMQRLRRYFETEQTVPWKRVYEISSGVEWSHKAHLGAGRQCETCHGNVKQLTVMKQVKAVTAMAVCIHCHEATGADTSCETCHAWPTDDYLLTKE